MATQTRIASGLRAFALEHEAAERAVSILSGEIANPTGYGRVIRNAEGDVEGIVEEKDATDEQRAVTEINSGILAFEAGFLSSAHGDAEIAAAFDASRIMPG